LRYTLTIVGGWLGRKRLRRRVPFVRYVSLRHRTLFNRPHRLTSFTVEDVEERLFRGLRHSLDRTAVDGDVDQDRRAWNVHVPDAVVNELKMPATFTRLQIDGDETFAEETVAWTMTAIVIAGRQLHG